MNQYATGQKLKSLGVVSGHDMTVEGTSHSFTTFICHFIHCIVFVTFIIANELVTNEQLL